MSSPFKWIYSKNKVHDIGVQALAYGWMNRRRGRGKDEIVVTTGSDGLIKVWSVDNDDRLDHKMTMSVLFETDYVFSGCAINRAGTLIATVSFDRRLRLWGPTGRLKGIIDVELEDVFSNLVFTPDSRHVITGAFGGFLRVFNVDTKTEERKIHTTVEENLTVVAVSGCGQLVAAAGDSGAVHVLQLPTATPLHLMKHHVGMVTSLEFSPDSKRILSAGLDMHLILYDVIHGKVLKDFWDHQSVIYSVTFSNDGHFFATGSNKDIRIWDCISLDCVHIFTEHKDAVWGNIRDMVTLIINNQEPCKQVASVKWEKKKNFSIFLEQPMAPMSIYYKTIIKVEHSLPFMDIGT